MTCWPRFRLYIRKVTILIWSIRPLDLHHNHKRFLREDPTAMSVQKTVFHACHQAAGAKLIDFGGWHMPVRYTSQVSEHHCVRNHVGLFDVSHMGEVFIEGPKALETVRHLVTNIWLYDGQAQYTCMCNHDGGIVMMRYTVSTKISTCFASMLPVRRLSVDG